MLKNKFFYSASVMGYGFGRKWHKYYNFQGFPRVTKSLTSSKRTGLPFAVIPTKNSVWNRVGLHNMGLEEWITAYRDYDLSGVIVSIHGGITEVVCMATLFLNKLKIAGIEVNASCPNAKNYTFPVLPITHHPLYLKLSHKQDPYLYDLDKVSGIRMNSVDVGFGAMSGKYAQEKNWAFIKKFNKEGLNVAGCSITSHDDIKRMEDVGCEEIGLGAVVLTDPKFVEGLKNEY